jgi:RND family efflux transporter MFP subunit
LAALGVLVSVAAVLVWAHEGHQALPSQGVTIDVEKGTILLGERGRKALSTLVADVQAGSLSDDLVAPATVVAPWRRHRFISARSGGKVVALAARPGERVTKGQLLAEIESLELLDLQRDLLDAHNETRLAEKTLKGLEAGALDGSIPEQTLLQARSRHQQSRNALAIARRKVLLLGVSEAEVDRLLKTGAVTLRTLPIHSPVKGTVLHVDAGVGQVVEPNEHLLEVMDLSRIGVQIQVLEKDLHRVKVGQSVTIRFAGALATNGEHAGKLQIKERYLDPRTHQGTVWTELPNPQGNLLPGMFGQARIRLRTSDGLVLPADALVSAGAERYVFVEEGPGQYRRANVVVQKRQGSLVGVASDTGLYPSDRVLTTGSHELSSFFVQGTLRLGPEAERNIRLQVEPAQRRTVAEAITLQGSVDLPPGGRAVASARLAGALERIAVERDQTVRAGDVVAEVASLEFQNLQLELLRSHLQLRLLMETSKRLRSGRDALPERVVRENEAALIAARQRRDGLQNKLRAVGLASAQLEAVREGRTFFPALPVRAPIDGAVVRFRAVLGQAVKAEDPLFEVHNLSGANLRVYVPARDLPRVRIGQRGRVRLTADPKFLGEAVIVRRGQALAAGQRTLPVWAELKTPLRASPLLPGMMVRMALVVAEGPPTLAVPREAVFRDGLRAGLFVQKTDGTFERRWVETGRSDDLFVAITAGLAEGERVAVRGVADLQTAYAAVK